MIIRLLLIKLYCRTNSVQSNDDDDAFDYDIDGDAHVDEINIGTELLVKSLPWYLKEQQEYRLGH